MQMGTIKSAKVGLEMIIRRLITLSAFLPSLPCNAQSTVPPLRICLANERYSQKIPSYSFVLYQDLSP